ncbi:SapC family protein [Sphingomonas sp. LY54]|uniref:SapC family protein n=1 Tax=Sphingomonas sp. LY54 TaxID=3095343 RepID=UPI002D77BD07|nr:SapC family protein [Sphingomonas sp. LY54]WRP29510.1 SapC family protein [Sphingomonas sp. LY54]
MASQAPNPQLPLFYNGLEPLSSNIHASFKTRAADSAPFLAQAHAIPITIDEFAACQRFYPIVFSTGDNPVPLALMGLNEGTNVFVDAEGKLLSETYIPAYIRRYPFMLARLRPDAEELSLCFDPSSGLVGEFEDGNALFDGETPSEVTNQVLKFCEEFEMSAQRTNAFMKELKESELLIDGEVSIQPSDSQQPFVYRGFQMVDEQKLRDAHGDKLRKMNQNGMLPLLFAHLFSLPLIREIFGKQMQQGKVPPQGEVAGNA